MELRGDDPRLASLDTLSGNQIPLHFLLRLHGHIIQVVFLYERSGNYLWHGALRLKPGMERRFASFKRLDYGRHAGAYDRPELVLTVSTALMFEFLETFPVFLSEQKHARFPGVPTPRRSELPAALSRRLLSGGRGVSEESEVAASSGGADVSSPQHPLLAEQRHLPGLVRQCSVISYSRDVDIGIFIADFRPDIIAAFRTAGLSLKHKFGKVEDSLELSFLSEDVKLDVFFFYEDGDIARSGRKFKYVFPGFSLCWAELLDLKVRVPCETLDYLSANYGPMWSVPLRSWDWKTSPSNVQENGAWPVAEWAELIQVY
ncbi:hypothetical protein JOQ06_002082 [Pogonophryne albipinna]|uniref:Ribitol-5-phosphate transferase FKTN N-terminal domain-containing protein n=1 Tax=Pogonophryne albipinna TaxID=1090488 RepID=A0AAD6A777_9TELE|nr:hypothetical protein JOQ06_002082 [Pogonophryne albipinna]